MYQVETQSTLFASTTAESSFENPSLLFSNILLLLYPSLTHTECERVWLDDATTL